MRSKNRNNLIDRRLFIIRTTGGASVSGGYTPDLSSNSPRTGSTANTNTTNTSSENSTTEADTFSRTGNAAALKQQARAAGPGIQSQAIAGAADARMSTAAWQVKGAEVPLTTNPVTGHAMVDKEAVAQRVMAENGVGGSSNGGIITGLENLQQARIDSERDRMEQYRKDMDAAIARDEERARLSMGGGMQQNNTTAIIANTIGNLGVLGANYFMGGGSTPSTPAAKPKAS